MVATVIDWKALRKESNTNQQDLADMAGVARSSLSVYETGGRSPKLDTTADLLDAMGYEIVVRKKERKNNE